MWSWWFFLLFQMFSEGAIRDEDREEIFRTILLHQNLDPQYQTLNFGLLKKVSSSLSLRSDKDSKSTLRKNSTVIKKLNRRGSVAVYHPARTNLLSPSSLSVVSEEVKLASLEPNQLLIFVYFRGRNWSNTKSTSMWTRKMLTPNLMSKSYKTNICWRGFHQDVKVLRCWRASLTILKSQLWRSFDWLKLSRFPTSSKSRSLWSFCLSCWVRVTTNWITMKLVDHSQLWWATKLLTRAPTRQKIERT